MATFVEYILGLKDELSAKIDNATSHVKGLETGMTSAAGKAKTLALEIGAAIGVTVAFVKIFEMVREGHEAWERLETANSQLIAGIKSTGAAAGVTFEQLDEMSDKMSHSFKFTKDQIADMQAQVLTFPAITKATFDGSSQAIIDMATRTHRGLDEIAIMVGKAMQDPERGITALRRVGVNFNDTQTEIIKTMVKTGHTAQAQTAILKELNVEFGGSAAAAAAADVGFRFKKTMEEVQLSLGEVANKIEAYLMPAFVAFANGLRNAVTIAKEFYHWIERNKTLLEDIAIVIGVTAAAWEIYTVISKAAVIWSQIKVLWFTAERAAIIGTATAMEFLNAAFISSPIGWIVTGIAAITAAVLYCWEHFEGFRKGVYGVWEIIKVFVKDAGRLLMGLAEMLNPLNLIHPEKMIEGFHTVMNVIKGAAQDMKDAWDSGNKEGADSWALAQAKKMKGLVPPKAGEGKIGPPGATTPPIAAPKTKAEGHKNINIHIAINGGLVHEMKFITTNIKESIGKIKEGVTAALTSAVNDSQIVANY